MSSIKFGDPFGLDMQNVTDDDWQLALKRIGHDLKSDFIFAPHVSFVLKKAKAQLIASTKTKLSSGKFLPGVPVTMDVPKSSRIKIASNPPRPGPNFSRPGSILLPEDRLVYQLLSDKAVEAIEKKTDKNRSFSHRIDESEPEKLFLPTRTCWSLLQKKLQEYVADEETKYVLKIDVANYFGSINQHTLVNVLSDAGYPKSYVNRLEVLLLSFAGKRSSRGIIQGVFPSDLLGNFYLEPIDRFLDDMEVPSARYVDDMFIFVKSTEEAEVLLRKLIPELRYQDLSLNEVKSVLIPKHVLHTEEPDLDALFQAAIEEISIQIVDEDFETEYGFQSDWEEEDWEDEADDEGEDWEEGAAGWSSNEAGSNEVVSNNVLEIKATQNLFDSLINFPGHEENIERFCLPLFSKAKSSYAVDYTIDAFKKRPSMAQIYCSYIYRFIGEDKVRSFLRKMLSDSSLHDWQRMWVLAALLSCDEHSDDTVKEALKILRDGDRHDALKAVAAIFVGKFGDAARRNNLRQEYSKSNPYVQSAIFYSSKDWPNAEKTNALAAWGNQGQMNQLIKAGMEAK